MTIRAALACLFLGLSASGYNSGNSPLSATEFGNKYKFTDNEVPGWTQTPVSATEPSPYNVYDGGAALRGRIDGNDVYSPRGCRVSMYQDLTGPSQEICTATAMDFVAADNANGMFAYRQLKDASVAVPGYGASDALASTFALGGETVYAHFKASYFELSLSGFDDDTSAGAAAKQFLDVFKSKTN